MTTQLPPKKAKKWLWLIPSIAVLSFMTAEITANAFGFGHPLLYRSSFSGYEPAPNQNIYRFGKKVTTNAIGLRGEDVPGIEKKRVLILGDSVAFGTTLTDDSHTFPALTQLALADLSAAVLNASAGGWALENERRWLAQHGTLGAKVLVLEINQRDLTQGYSPHTILDNHPSFPTRNPTTALHEIAVRYIGPKLRLNAAPVDPGSTGQMTIAPAEDIFSHIYAIHSMSKAAGCKLIILYWDMRDPKTDSPERRERLFTWAKAQNITVIRPQLHKRPDANNLFLDAAHPNSAGNALIAKQLANAIRADI